jgi:signal transduction histidine kinase
MKIMIFNVSGSPKMKFVESERDLKLRILMFSLIVGAGFIAVISLDIYAELPSLFVSANLVRETLLLPLLSLVFCFLSLLAVRSARKTRNAVASSVAESGSLQVKEIASKISHDLRSPLTALMVAHQSSSNLNPEMRELLVCASQRIKEITNQLAQY